jgi:hypothetical protein
MKGLGGWFQDSIGSRRLVYLGMLLAVIVPMVWQISFKEHASPMVRDVFDAVAGLPPEAKVLIAFDFDPASEPEIKPMGDAFVRHLCQMGAKLYCLTLWPTGPAEINLTIREIIEPEFPEYVYGRDFVNLGFMSGGEGTITVAATDIKKAFSADAHNVSTSDGEKLPIMQRVENLESFDLIINLSAGYPGLQEWVQYGANPTGRPIVGGSVAVGSPELLPFVPDQCIGFLAGLKGAAEYEQLLLEEYPQLDRPECRAALERMGPQTVAHLFIILLILIGNGIHLRRKRKGEV